MNQIICKPAVYYVCRREKKSISGSIDDVEAFSKLNDSILSLIAMSNNPNLKPAQEMIKRIEKRQLYKYIGQTAPIDENKVKYSKVRTYVYAAIYVHICCSIN